MIFHLKLTQKKIRYSWFKIMQAWPVFDADFENLAQNIVIYGVVYLLTRKQRKNKIPPSQSEVILRQSA